MCQFRTHVPQQDRGRCAIYAQLPKEQAVLTFEHSVMAVTVGPPLSCQIARQEPWPRTNPGRSHPFRTKEKRNEIRNSGFPRFAS